MIFNMQNKENWANGVVDFLLNFHENQGLVEEVA